MDKKCIQPGLDWFDAQEWKPFPFQLEAWEAYLEGRHGLVNAPTGSGKTYSLLIPILLEYLTTENKQRSRGQKLGLRAIWITPIRALAKEIKAAAERAIIGLDLPWTVGMRTGDTKTSERNKQRKDPPQILITTPESLHLLLASKGYPRFFGKLKAIIVDEWHELMGSKRGVQMELAISRLRHLLPEMRVWGISATIGNMDDALAVLLPHAYSNNNYQLIKANIKKEIEVETVLPDEIEKFPWAGHLGITLLKKVLPIIEKSSSTLIFTNTRAMCEIWYQKLLEVDPDLSGAIAMHHGSISRPLRDWVENALHEGQLKAVVCTASLDLGVDFRPVETIVQIGSPKGVARFVQRAGRSGHQPGAKSKIYFVPTHSLELLEGAALRQAIAENRLESRFPYMRSFDVLVQYLITLAVSEGFYPEELYKEITETFSYQTITPEEWDWIIRFIRDGGDSLQAYDEYKKVVVQDRLFKVEQRGIAMRHRLSIGTIVGDSSMIIKYVSGKRIGNIEEWFIAQLRPGDTFWFAGRSLELVRIKGMEVQVRKSNKKKGKVPSWMGGKMPLSSELAYFLRLKMMALKNRDFGDVEVGALEPLLETQEMLSVVPDTEELLIEYLKTKEGYHLMVYPFEGRFVHEGMGTLIAYRISKIKPISFSIAMNDYGFELLSDIEIPIKDALNQGLFSSEKLIEDIKQCINAAEMARRRFRDIASIAGLVFKGFPGKQKKERHLQSSSQLFFEVFSEYEPDNLLLQQSYEEVMSFQLEETRLRMALDRIRQQKVVLTEIDRPTPFAFPIIVERLNREKLSSEKLEDRVKKMKIQLEM